MPLSQENKVIEMKYADIPFGKMDNNSRTSSAYGLLLKIHVITGWTIPASDELMEILADQFQKKLNEKYQNVNKEEFEYAFRNRGIDVKDWGKALNLTMIDDVMIPYLANRFDLSRAEESLMYKHTFLLNQEEKKELTPEEWMVWINEMRNYDVDIIPCAAYDYLVKNELLILSNDEKHAYMERAIAKMTGMIEPGTVAMMNFMKMKEEKVYSADITGTLITLAKRFAIVDYFIKNPIDNGDTTGDSTD